MSRSDVLLNCDALLQFVLVSTVSHTILENSGVQLLAVIDTRALVHRFLAELIVEGKDVHRFGDGSSCPIAPRILVLNVRSCKK